METIYKGRKMRSQLEARWAAFFDKVGWEYDYEPSIDLKGWLPDFILYASSYVDDNGVEKKHKIFVEVKPFSTKNEFKEAQAKIDIATKGTPFEDTEVLLLGLSIFKSKIYKEGDYSEASGILGWLYQTNNTPKPDNINYSDNSKKLTCETYVIAIYDNKKTLYDLTDDDMFSRFQGYWEHCYGSSYTFDWSYKLNYNELKKLWDSAGNDVQWTKSN